MPSAAAGALTGQDALLATGNRTFIQPWSSGVGNEAFLRWCFVATALTLAGCSNTSWRKSEVLAVPLQPTLQQEVILARMEQILASRALTDDERAQLLYERGVLYDSLGLRALARNDFSQALAIRPDMPEVFNYLGIYLTQAGNFDAAYEAFDSVLELDPTYNYAHLNRGIALYYGGRDKLAQDDLLAFYQDDPNDPFRSLWLYLAEQKLDEKQAKEVLKQHFENRIRNSGDGTLSSSTRATLANKR